MSVKMQLNRTKMKLESIDVSIVVLKQREIKILVREELGHLLLIDAADSSEMYLLASLFKHSMKSRDVIYLERESDTYTDLFIFNGAIVPLTWKNLRQIKSSIRFTKPEVFRLALLTSHDEASWDSWEHWKYEEQLRVTADKDIGIINSSQLGFELLVQQCLYLASSFSGHAHFDWNSTKHSIELMIRNIARN